MPQNNPINPNRSVLALNVGSGTASSNRTGSGSVNLFSMQSGPTYTVAYPTPIYVIPPEQAPQIPQAPPLTADSVSNSIANQYGLPVTMVRQVVQLLADPELAGRDLNSIANDPQGVKLWTEHALSKGINYAKLGIRFSNEVVEKKPINNVIVANYIANTLGMDPKQTKESFDQMRQLLKNSDIDTAQHYESIIHWAKSIKENGLGRTKMIMRFSDEGLRKAPINNQIAGQFIAENTPGLTVEKAVEGFNQMVQLFGYNDIQAARDFSSVAHWANTISSQGLGTTRMIMRFSDAGLAHAPINNVIASKFIANNTGITTEYAKKAFDKMVQLFGYDDKTTARDFRGVEMWARRIHQEGEASATLAMRFSDAGIAHAPINNQTASDAIASGLNLNRSQVLSVFNMYTSILKRNDTDTARDFNGIKHQVDGMNHLIAAGLTPAQAQGEIRMNIQYSDEGLRNRPGGVPSFEQVADDIALNFGALNARFGGFRPELAELCREAGMINSTSSVAVGRNHAIMRGAISTYINNLDAGQSSQNAMNAAKTYLREHRFA